MSALYEKRKYSKVWFNPKKPPQTDWLAFDALTVAKRHWAGLSDADGPPATAAQLARARRVPPSAPTYTGGARRNPVHMDGKPL